MIIESLSFTVLSAHENQFGDALASVIGSIQVQSGCLGCQMLKSWPMENGLHMVARWDSEGDLIRHLQSEPYKRLILLMELSAAPPVLEFFGVYEIRGLNLVESARTLGEGPEK